MLNETSVAHGMGLEMSCVFDLFAAAGVALMAIAITQAIGTFRVHIGTRRIVTVLIVTHTFPHSR